MDLKSLLNKEQYDAATTIDGQVLILAGAGSGKTRVLTYRMAHMIEDLKIYPSYILAITFTNKAAAEMRERVRAIIGDTADRMWISTFHSSCVKILRREIDKIGYKKDFTIYDTYDQKALIKQCMAELNVNPKDMNEGEILGKIGRAKDNLITPTQFKRENEKNFRDNKIADVYALYQQKLKSNNALDFDDLISKTIELFKTCPDVLDFYQNKFKYIMVDEYQDTNKAQYLFISMLAAKYRNICVVGDDDQCLVEGTKIKTLDGYKNVEDIKIGDFLVCASGSGEVHNGVTDLVNKKEYNGPIIKVTTKSGKIVKATPNHLTFTRINANENDYYVYLMYKRGYGYRIGQTSGSRIREGRIINGVEVRLNGEQGDKVWILRVCDNKGEASYYEQFYSVKYGIPTVVFNARGRRITMSQDQINQMFQEINTYDSATRLMEDLYLCEDYPHHQANAVIRGESFRRIVNINFFAGKKGEECKYYSHRVSLNTSGEDLKDVLSKEGFPTRDGNRETFRIETERREYDEAESYAKSIAVMDDTLGIVRKARILKDKSLYFMNFGSLRKGMSIAIYDNGELVEDIVESVEIENYNGFVYDLSVPSFRQYIADDVLVHNCIYQWRGADIRNILDFEKDYPNAKTIKLEQNYRSVANILGAANEVIKNNSERKSKVLRTESEAGEKVRVYNAYSDIEEASFVASQIKKISETEGRSYKEFAILYRTNAQSRTFEDAFMKADIPYRIIGGLKFYDRKEIKDIMAYLKVIANPDDGVSLRRIINVPKRSIGDATVDKVQQHANDYGLTMYDAILGVENVPSLTARNIACIAKFRELIEELRVMAEQLPVGDFIEYILEVTGYLNELKNSKSPEDESRIENLKELVSAAAEFEKNEEDNTLSAFLEKTVLVADVDNYDQEAEGVVLMTVHSAKGLEFPVVFMVGMENGIFPGQSSLNNEKEMEESRRLCYVGITRAREVLYMTHANSRMVFGRTQGFAPSDFLFEISNNLKMMVDGRGQEKGKSTYKEEGSTAYKSSNTYVKPRAVNPHSLRSTMGASSNPMDEIAKAVAKSSGTTLTASEATPGRKVKHEKFGIGTIVTTAKSGDDLKLTIAFDKMGVKQLLLSFAPLELL